MSLEIARTIHDNQNGQTRQTEKQPLQPTPTLELPFQPSPAFSIEMAREEIEKENAYVPEKWLRRVQTTLSLVEAFAIPETPFNWDTLDDWTLVLQQSLNTMGLSEGGRKKIIVIRQQIRDQGSLGQTCLINDHTIQLDSSLVTDNQVLITLAHEIAHIEAGHCVAASSLFYGGPEFALALHSDEHIESQAQIFALEALASVAYQHPDPQVRLQARRAAITQLQDILSKSLLFELASSPNFSLDEDQARIGFYYGYIPEDFLSTLAVNSDAGFPLLFPRQNFVVGHVRLPATVQFLKDFNLTG